MDDRWGYRNKRTLQPGQNKTDPDNAPTPSFSAVHGARSGAAGRKGRVKREDNEDAFDEVEFEEEMQDDEEGTGTFGDEAIEEEDAKLLEERIKRSQRGGNHLSGGIDTTQAEDDSAVFNAKQEILDKAGRRAQKLLRKHKANDEEDDDDSSEEDTKVKNPYALQEVIPNAIRLASNKLTHIAGERSRR